MKNLTARWLLAVALPFSLVAAACGDDSDDGGAVSADGSTTTAAAADGSTTTAGSSGGSATSCSDVAAPADAPDITIGAQDFGESAILAQMYKQCLEAAGFTVSIQEVGGFRDVELTAFDSGDINLAPEYAASMLEALNDHAGEASSDVDATVSKLNTALEAKGLTSLTPSEAVDTNAFVVTQDTSESDGITKISDLADHTDFTLGAPADCETNAFCLPGLQSVYGIDLSSGFTALEAAAIAPALDSGDIDVALLFSTDSRIATNNYVLLEDDKHMLAADNVLPVLTNDLAGVDGVSDALDLISAVLTTDDLIELNRKSDVDVEDPDKIAGDYLSDKGLV